MKYAHVSGRAVTAAALTTTVLLALAGCGEGRDGVAAAKAPASLKVAGVTVKKDAKLHEALPDAVKKSGTVRVATDVPYAPFEMFVTEGRRSSPAWTTTSVRRSAPGSA